MVSSPWLCFEAAQGSRFNNLEGTTCRTPDHRNLRRYFEPHADEDPRYSNPRTTEFSGIAASGEENHSSHRHAFKLGHSFLHLKNFS